MASYLLQLTYTAEAWAALLKHPQDRTTAVQKVIEKLGGKVGPFWMAFGEYDLVGMIEMPDNIAAAAFAMAITAGGACRVKTTALISVEEGVKAMKKADNSGYKPVTKKK